MLSKLPAPVKAFTGIMRELFEDCVQQTNGHEGFALASTLHVMSTLTQRPFVVRNGRFSSTSMFQLIVAPPGSGKDAFVKWTERYITAVNKELHAKEWRSAEAGKATFLKQPSQSLIIDEIGSRWLDAYSVKNRNAIEKGITDLCLVIHNGVDRLAASAAKDKSREVAEVEFPRLSLLGLTTPADYHQLMQMDGFARRGMLSRLVLWKDADLEFPALSFDAPVMRTNHELVTRLQRMANGWEHGLEADGPSYGKVEVTFSEEAHAVFLAWGRRLTDKARGEAEAGERDEVADSVRTRLFVWAGKLACLHSIGNERNVVTPEDATVAVWIARNRELMFVEHIRERLPEGCDAVAAKLVGLLERKGGSCQVRDLYRGCRPFDRMALKDQADLLRVMARLGQIVWADGSTLVSLPTPDDEASTGGQVIPLAR